jgi:DNA (cytosine-5)-methyltransferase 1
MKEQHFTFIDLFCGCGGFSLGMERAGFQCLAAVDFNPEAIRVFAKNFGRVAHVLERDLTRFAPAELASMLGTDEVDVIVGGPPCQGFSTVRQVDGANNGKRLVEDRRRHLYKEFLRYVKFFQPKVFVMENVLGIRSASGGEYFAGVQNEARALGYRVHAQIEDCVKLGLPQKRRRQLFIGTRLDMPDYFRPKLKPAPRIDISHDGSKGLKLPLTLWEAIGDLPPLAAGFEESEYDVERFAKQLERYGSRYLIDVLELDLAKKLTAHRARPHSERDLRDFALLKEGENSKEAMKRGVNFEFPYDKETFKDRYTRQHRNEPCSTIVAHLSKDGLMFIHPTQNRSLTPREAARIQSFPDWFEFPIARTHQFRVIGNAVPPLVGEAVGIAVKSYIEKTIKKLKTIKFELSPLPKDEKEAVNWLRPLLDLDSRALRSMPAAEFKRAWYSIAFIYMGLHPDSALEHGERISHDMQAYPPLSQMEPRLVNPYYEQSGWPVVLGPVAKEAWRRYEIGEMTDDEFYCSEAQMAGICHRSPKLAEEVRAERKKVA